MAHLDEQIAKNESELAEAKAERERELVTGKLEAMPAAIRQKAPAFDAAALALVEGVTRNPAKLSKASRFAQC